MGSFIQTLEEAIISFPNTTYYQIMGFRATIPSLLLLTILIICTSNHVGGKYLLVETVDKPTGGPEAENGLEIGAENGLEIGTENDYACRSRACQRIIDNIAKSIE